MAPRVASIGLLPHQAEFINDETSKIICLTAGVGSGKTRGLAWKALRLAYVNAPHSVLIVLPTYKQLHAVFVETWALCMGQAGVRYHYHRSDSAITLTMGGRLCKLLLRSGDNPESFYGLNVAAALIDEWETLEEETVRVIRERIRDGVGVVNQLGLSGTPESISGFGAKWCEDAEKIGMRQIIARTSDNWHLKQSYVDDLTAMMSEGEIQARLNGIRTAKMGRVYTRFDRTRHHADAPTITYKDLPQIQLWCDFNVDAMTWAVVVKRENECHIIDEILGSKNGTDVLEHGEYARSRIALLCGTSEREVMQAKVKVVCDAAGQQRSSNSNLTAVQILRSLGFDVRFPSSNPSIEASVQSVQLALAKGRIKIDTKKCRYITRCLEQQGYDKTTGKPEKLKGEADLSHGADLLRYGVHMYWPGFSTRANEPVPKPLPFFQR